MNDIDPRVLSVLERQVTSGQGEDADWHNKRKNAVTCSVAPAVLSPEKSVTHKRTMTNYVYSLNSFTGSAATRHGTDNEPVALDLYCSTTGKSIIRAGLVKHKTIPWLGGSPDAITTDGILVEVKCPYTRKPKNEVPRQYVDQVQCLMEVMDLDQCHFVQYYVDVSTFVPKEVLIITEVARDRRWAMTNIPRMNRFWDKVLVQRSLMETRHRILRECAIYYLMERMMLKTFGETRWATPEAAYRSWLWKVIAAVEFTFMALIKPNIRPPQHVDSVNQCEFLPKTVTEIPWFVD
jgi:putative phage-type endonuclease